MKILVTGGAGFIGSNLCERLVKEHEVVSIDNYSTGSISNHVPNVIYYNMNTKDISTLDFNPDLIFHLGEYSRVEQSFTDISTVMDSNFTGTYEVLKFAKKHNAKLIYAGSSTKFGDIGSDSSPYAFTKATNTQLVQNYAQWYGLNYAITYFYNAYGKNEIPVGTYATLIAKFATKYKLGEPLTVTLPGTQLRNFTHVDDIVDGLVLVGLYGFGDGYGIGSPESYSVLEIANMFGGTVNFTPEKQGNRLSAPVLTEKTQALGWSAKRNVKDYIYKIKN
jgi:UDP-glucose 4-epimerase